MISSFECDRDKRPRASGLERRFLDSLYPRLLSVAKYSLPESNCRGLLVH